ncbi:MAG TPA: MMPL family transporter [Dehalococcoidia bacterium]|nr:MMPL family transporter [Dehalococcoidia bacterium]
MALGTAKLARASARHPWRVVVLWVAALVGSFALIGALLPGALTNEADVTTDLESERGQKLIEQLRGPFRVHEAILVESQTLTVDDPAFKAYVEQLHAGIAALGPEIVEQSTSYYISNDPSLVSTDRRTTLIPLVMAGDIDDATKNIKDVLAVIEKANETDRFHVFASGFASVSEDFNKALEKDLQRSEFGTLPLALIILIAVFGAVVAAFIPLGLAFAAIIAAVALTAIIGQQFKFTFFVTNMILMMGLAVGIDYCLFIVSRFREERARGLDKLDAISVAAGTAGRAVLFSGLTVVVALTGLLIVPQTIFRSLSGGAILVVLASVAASLTLLPALLSLLGDRVNSLRIPFVQKAQKAFDELAPGGFWDRVAHTVMGRPVISVVAVTGLLVAASVPYTDIELGFAGLSTLPDSFPSKQGFLRLQEKFAGGQVYPAEVVIQGDVDSPAVQGGIERLKAIVARDHVFGPSQLEKDASGDLGVLSISLAADPNARLATDAIERLREQYIPQAFQGVDAEVLVAGLAAENLDGYQMTAHYLPIVVAFVLGLSFILLTMVFRSIVVPAKAIVMNLLSVGAAYGLIVLIFQKGFAKDLLGFQQVESIEAWLPLFLFSILFGLSMDYHVFLLSRIKERYDLTGDNTGAVAFGLRSTGRLITGAALIMVTVFGGFAIGDLVMFQQMGFGLGVAVLVDATVIRSVLVPASMKLLGRWNWYLPPVLQWLPHVGIEGSHAAPTRALAAEPTTGGG